ncbi:MAG: hypothetical protein O7B26_00325, partial [Planctomycetota bacterium]|nr:hypothetical protein [Planctomycetota bacterium]
TDFFFMLGYFPVGGFLRRVPENADELRLLVSIATATARHKTRKQRLGCTSSASFLESKHSGVGVA